MATGFATEEAASQLDEAKSLFISRVRIRGYKSISFCDVPLSPLTVLVGRNGSGKSNFVSALQFARDFLREGLYGAIEAHGGKSLFNKLDNDAVIEIKIWIQFQSMRTCEGSYSFRIRGDARSGAVIESEQLDLRDHSGAQQYGFVRDEVSFRFLGEDNQPQPYPTASHPYLLLSELRQQPYIDLQLSMRSVGCFNFMPDAMRQLYHSVGSPQLEDSGANFARTIEGMREIDAGLVQRVMDYLGAIVPDVAGFEAVNYGEYETVRFNMRTGNGIVSFDASSMSDGTLRALASLLAVFQVPLPHGRPSLVAIEEPETALHPAAMRVLVDAIDEATFETQVILTTHSAELLDNPTIRPENVRVVEMVDGRTIIGAVDEASVEIVSRKINSLGNLERDDVLKPDLDSTSVKSTE